MLLLRRVYARVCRELSESPEITVWKRLLPIVIPFNLLPRCPS